MSPESQRIAIAQALGLDKLGPFRYASRRGNLLPEDSTGPRLFYISSSKGGWNEYDDVPDYLSDLNAMHEAEKQLTSGQWVDYKYELATASGATIEGMRNLISATASQRAEAFLRTLNLWNENE